jgi:hypothetical protein
VARPRYLDRPLTGPAPHTRRLQVQYCLATSKGPENGAQVKRAVQDVDSPKRVG